MAFTPCNALWRCLECYKEFKYFKLFRSLRPRHAWTTPGYVELGVVEEPVLNHRLICVECELLWREDDLKKAPKYAVDELFEADPDWCTLKGVRRDTKRVRKGSVWVNTGRQLKRAMDEARLERKTANEMATARVNFVSTNDGRPLMIGNSEESPGSSSKELPSALMSMAGMKAKAMKREVLSRVERLSNILIT